MPVSLENSSLSLATEGPKRHESKQCQEHTTRLGNDDTLQLESEIVGRINYHTNVGRAIRKDRIVRVEAIAGCGEMPHPLGVKEARCGKSCNAVIEIQYLPAGIAVGVIAPGFDA